VVLDGTGDAATADLRQGQICVEGSCLVRVLAITQPRHLPQWHRYFWRWLFSSCTHHQQEWLQMLLTESL
jgi:hypothetical protein